MRELSRVCDDRPRVEEANHNLPAFSRVFKETILVSDLSRPLPRAGKGTIQRKKALELYAHDIEQLYKTVEESSSAHGVAPPPSWDVKDVQSWLAEHAAGINDERVVDPDRDLFEQGFDSLSATFLRNRIIGTLRESSDDAINTTARHVPQNFIFQHPTLSSLAEAVAALVRSDDSVVQSPSEEIEATIEKYTALLPARAPEVATVGDGERVVLLTGTTGNLGAHVLALLLSEERTKRVYALNRGSGLMHRQRAAFDAAQLPLELLDHPKLTLLSVDYTRDDLGLSQDNANEVVTHIVHSAWRVDFNLALTSFGTQIASAIRLLALAPAAHYLFTSSVSAASGWNVKKDNHGAHVPEAALHDSSIAAATSGYGMSKYVVEEVLASAHQRGLKTTSLRIGQISGSSKGGVWNASEWVPNIVKSSLALGALPDAESVVSWVPMDAVARVVVDVVLGREAPELINVVHPRPVEWSAVFGAMQAELSLEYLRVASGEDRTFTSVMSAPYVLIPSCQPGIKLLDYYRTVIHAEAQAKRDGVDGCEAGGLPFFETSKACSVSKTLAELPPLGAQDARAWVIYWKSIGFLP
ncbi:hypothetical protein EVJ58_g3467 [Rhodofomes roseus]|uniref:Carrier domain-containing protein n=1 Tax=Rhodofomes roseus TaxID=34475 RepID=A0A4Y9YN12_9APHY|nr:hypothetical protein EVJ58_g3467 [Rhodofomes roseus]